MPAIRTAVLPGRSDYTSPGGAAEIRLLLQFPAGEITHARVPAGLVSVASWIHPSIEYFYVLDGEGLLWDGASNRELALRPGVAYRIPSATPIQYRAARTLEFLVIVVPQWRRDYHHAAVVQHWTPTQ